MRLHRLRRLAVERRRARCLLRRVRGWTRTPAAGVVARYGAAAGRAGYVGKGALYGVVGGLAIDAGVSPATRSRRRAITWMRAVLAHPLGRWALLAGVRDLRLAGFSDHAAAGARGAPGRARVGLAEAADLFRERLAGGVAGGLLVRRHLAVRRVGPLAAA